LVDKPRPGSLRVPHQPALTEQADGDVGERHHIAC
jgi:hypothetical protein